MLACAHIERVHTCGRARVRGFTRARQGVGGNRVRVYVVADKDILARAMSDKEMVMVRLMIGNGKA